MDGAQTRFFDGAIDLLEPVGLDGDKDNLDLFVGAATDDLIIPNDFIDRERNILLRLERR